MNLPVVDDVVGDDDDNFSEFPEKGSIKKDEVPIGGFPSFQGDESSRRFE